MTSHATQVMVYSFALSYMHFSMKNKANSAHILSMLYYYVIVKTNQQNFFMVYTLKDHRNDAIKYPKLGRETMSVPLEF